MTGWEYFIKTVQIDGRVYDLLANVRKKPEGEYVYSIQLNEDKKKAPAPLLTPDHPVDDRAHNRVLTDASMDSIPETGKDVKGRFSLKTDSEGRELTREQAEFFKDSKVRLDEYGDYGEEDGALAPVYHATYDDFTVFDREHLGELTDENAREVLFAATSHLGFWFNTQDLSQKSTYDGGADKGPTTVVDNTIRVDENLRRCVTVLDRLGVRDGGSH